MENLLLNQVAIITGASAGIGKAIALKFASHGARVILIGTHLGRGAVAVKEIMQATPGCSAEFYQVDVSNYQAVQDAMAEI